MTALAEPAPVEAARGLRELIEAHADRAETERDLPAPVVEALVEHGLMRLCVPAAYGGPECDPMTLVRAVEAVAEADGAAGWCAMIASSTSSMSMFLPPATAERIYGDSQVVTGGVFAPSGRGVGTDGGWKVSGRWQWGSGTQHCQWITGGMIGDDGVFRLAFFPADQVTFHDTWHTVGMRGTGSVDFSVDDAVVPEDHTLQPLAGRRTIECRLAAFPNFSLLAAGVAAVGLGVARRALDEVTALASEKTPLFSSKSLSRSGYTQIEVARADAALRAARAFLLHELAEAWDRASDGQRVDLATRARIRLAGVHAAETGARVADTAFTLAGGSSVFSSSPLQRCLRDAHVATQHLMVAPKLYETLGRFTLGLDVDTSTL